MKIGFIDTIFAKKSFEQVMDFASMHDFANVEMACWPTKSQQEIDEFMAANGNIQESLLNYFLGITHIDVHALDADKIEYIKAYQRNTGVVISALAYYANPLEAGETARQNHIDHYRALIDAASALDVNMITSFVGRDQLKTVEENIELAVEFWAPIVDLAHSKGVKIAIENCPMYFNEDQWPGGQNLMTTPKIWREMFNRINSESFGLCYDPSHMIFQHMDYVKPIHDFADKIFYVHFKDATIYKDLLNQVGIMGYPLQYSAPKLPGLGDVNWGQFISALYEVGFKGFTSIEIEDKAFEHSEEAVQNSLLLSKKYLQQFVI